MRHRFIVLTSLFLFVCSNILFAQKNCGKLKSDKSYQEKIETSTYHQYELNLKKGTVALLVLDYNVGLLLTVVNPEGIIVEKVSTNETASHLIFESTIAGKYQFYINTLEDEKKQGNYTLNAHYLPSNKDGKLDQIKKLIQLLQKPNRAGLAIAILQDNQSIFEHYNGFSNVENQIYNNKETVFELASVSKQFTAFAIAMLDEEGKLSVEDDIRKYFPELPIYKTPIQIKHLLNHTSGIIESDNSLELAGFENDPIGIDRVLNFLKNTPDQYFESGSEFSYSNDGYTLLGELVTRVTKQSFKSWMKKNLFDPLKMKHTSIRDSPQNIIPNRAISYAQYNGDSDFLRRSFDFFAPGGCSVRSNISDLIKWVNYLDQGYVADEKIFKKINQRNTFNDGDTTQYSYGNFITDFRGLKRISHLGLSAGFTTSIARFPEQNVSFILLGTDGEFPNYYLSRKMYEIYLEEQLKPITKKFEGIKTAALSKETQKEIKSDLQAANMKDYEGTYFSQQINTTYTFQVQQDTLFALSAAYPPIPIIAAKGDTLETDEDFMISIIFKRGYDGNVSDCRIYHDDDDYSIAFTKISTAKKWPKSSLWKSKVYVDKMKEKLTKVEASKKLVGFGVTVFDETETFLQEGYGFANIENGKRYNAETVQLIASISKSITGTAVMKAMELVHFQLDDAINDYLPYKIINPKFPEEEITIRHLLTHTSSLDDPDNYRHGYVFQKPLIKDNWPVPHHKTLHFYNNNEKLPLSDFLDLLISPKGKWYDESKMFTKEKPGTNFEYSNLGFALLGYIIELTSKVDFKDFTQKHIFDPLDMKSATWELAQVNPAHETLYYLENYNTCPPYACNTLPDGNLYINMIDLTKFLQEAIRGYAGRGKILSQSSYQEMFRSQTDLFEIEGGLGWDLSISCCIGHAGNDFGASTVMYFEPKTGIGRIVFCNTSSELEEIADEFYGIMNLLFLEDL